MRVSSRTERLLTTYLPPALVALLALPFVLHQNAWWEWSNLYWYLERQTEHVSATGRPTLFLHLSTGAFNPWYVYYAGPALTALAYPAVVLGPWTTFAGALVAAIVAGYAGIWWTARNLGLSRRLAILPALTFVATPYVVGNLYGRGAGAELIAVNAVAVLLGGLTAVLVRTRGRETGALVAIVLSTAVIAGTHNLTLLWSAIILPPTLLALLLLRPPGAAPVLPAVGRAIAAGALGLGLTAAWLLPNIWYGRDTVIAQKWVSDSVLEESFGGVNSFSNLLSPWPKIPEQVVGHWLYPQAPVLVLAWVVAMLGVALWRRSGPRRLTVASAVLLALAAGLLVVVANPTWWLHFPSTLRTIQYPFRLLSFVAILVALGAVVALRRLPAAGRARRWGVATLTLAVGVQVAAGAFVAIHSQASSVDGQTFPRVSDVRADTVPAAYGDEGTLTPAQFRVLQHPTVRGPVSTQATVSMTDPLTSDTAALTGRGRVGTQVLVRVAWSPYLRITGGATLLGRDKDGMAVLRVKAVGPDGGWTATAASATPWPLAVGRAISAASALLLLCLCGAALVRGRRRRAPDEVPVPPEPLAVAS